ncbi:MAG: GTPase HflX, partial [Acidobacteriota bacterium]
MGVYSSPRERWEAQDSLEELASLARTAGAVVLESVVQFKEKRDPRFCIGKGKIIELSELCQKEGINLVIFDEPLSPSQVRNIENAIGQKVIDRNQLILDIFARRARSKEGKLQVELAQLNYFLPRLGGKGLYLSQLGGGIGTRGPGETKLEFDRRKIKNRIAKIRRQIQRVVIFREQQRKRRESRLIPLASLVGYTNAGKTTLFNLLTNSDAPTSHDLFNTLDPLIRRLRLPDGQLCLLSDTVGFIRKLPPELIAAFRATLEEVKKADLLINVIDISDPNFLEQHKEVNKVLESLPITHRPIINVLNKIDLIPTTMLSVRGRMIDNPIYLSAFTGDGKDTLLRRI